MRYGIRAARYDVVVTMDDDFQHPVSEIAPLLAALRPGIDVVYGAPLTEQHGLLRDIASGLTKLALASTMGAQRQRLPRRSHPAAGGFPRLSQSHRLHWRVADLDYVALHRD
jgi:glycosyltransferase involved in cell wall biosynthesis